MKCDPFIPYMTNGQRTRHPEGHPISQSRYGSLRQTNQDIWQEAVECPETILETASHRISLRQLRYCAYHAPHIAYKIRKKLSEKRRAVILGYTIEMAGLAFNDDEVKAYLDELVDSMILYPSVWRVTFSPTFRIRRSIES